MLEQFVTYVNEANASFGTYHERFIGQIMSGWANNA